MAQFYDLRVADVRQETDDTVSVAFEIPGNLRETFQYSHGQYLTLKMDLNGEEVRRSYSLSSSPDEDDEWRIAVKLVPGGKMSTAINQNLKVGDTVATMAPMGNFTTAINPNAEMHYVAFAAGSGITPVISILKSVLKREPKSTFTLFYGNRTSSSIIFKNELEALQSRYNGRLNVVNVLSRETTGNRLTEGRIDRAKTTALLEAHCDVTNPGHYFICGPGEMINSVSALLQNLRVDKSNIHFELFTTPVADTDGADASSAGGDDDQVEGEYDAEVTVIIDGDEYEFELNTNDQAILDAALEEGADAPFACKGAVCCTCKGKVIKGKVKMDMNYALEDDEVEEGYVLTCQSHPITPKVTIDFDV